MMGRVAEGALAEGGSVIGIIPRYMQELEWGHTGITELHEVENMHQRKMQMMQQSEGIVALPGGTGTLEELLEAITWKRLGLVTSPIIIVNIKSYYDPLIAMLERSIDENFTRADHRTSWQVVNTVEEVIDALHNTPPWQEQSASYAVV